MNISIVIPNYNGEHLLKKNLPSVKEALENYLDGHKGFGEIIIVDDASTDNSIVEIKKIIRQLAEKNDIAKIKIIQNEKNLGFSSTVNRGVMHSTGEEVVLLNTDVRPEKDFLTPLLKHFSEPSVFGVGCMDKSIEKGEVVLRGRGVGKWDRGFLVHSAGDIGEKQSTLWVSGGSSAFRLSMWKELGGFDELFNPFYWEDIDLSYRGKKAGYHVLFEKESVVTHEHESGAIHTTTTPFRIKTIAYRNQFVFVWKNITDWNLLMSHVLWLPYHLITLVSKGEMQFILGFMQALSLLPYILSSRAQIKRHFIKTDEEIISQTNN